jgi:yecA family protein
MGNAASLNGFDGLHMEMVGLESTGEEDVEDGAAISFANGLITAVAVAPRLIAPDEWMPLFIGKSSGDLKDEEEGEMEAARQLLLVEYRKILDSLAARDGSYEPQFCEDADGNFETKSWAEGFLAGVQFAGDAWDPVFDTDDGAVDLVTLFLLLEDEEFLAKVTEDGELGREECLLIAQAEVPSLIQQLYDLSPFGAQGNRGAVVPPAKNGRG